MPKRPLRFLLWAASGGLTTLVVLYALWDAPPLDPLPDSTNSQGSETYRSFLELDISEATALYTNVFDLLYAEDFSKIDEIPQEERLGLISQFDQVAEKLYPSLNLLFAQPGWVAARTAPKTSPSVSRLSSCLRFVNAHRELADSLGIPKSSSHLELPIRIAAQSQQDAQTPICCTMALGVTGVALRDTVLEAPSMSVKITSDLRTLLANFSETDTCVVRMLRNEHRNFRVLADSPDWDELGDWVDSPITHAPSIFFKKNASIRLHDRLTQSWISNVQSPLHAENTMIDATIRSNEKDSFRPLRSNNPLGEAFVALMASSHSMISQLGRRVEAQKNLTLTYLAILLYHHDHQSLPPTLEALVPTYLPAIPTDPFDGQPIRYNPTENRLYSVGTDLQDHGGSTDPKPFQPHTEPTIQITLPN